LIIRILFDDWGGDERLHRERASQRDSVIGHGGAEKRCSENAKLSTTANAAWKATWHSMLQQVETRLTPTGPLLTINM
jgi:hypothetical protein